MATDLDETVPISLSKSAWLVIFELLASSSEQWRKSNLDDPSANPMQITAADHAQRVALWWLEGGIEKTLPELFAPNYGELIEESKRRLAEKN
jgi:hypothetical protein